MPDHKCASLADFLAARSLTVDRVAADGWGAEYPIKGREIDAAILFADIANFSGRTETLSPTETLAFVNHFFAWISAEALQNTHAIVDKYIGDEIMIVFSHEFGCKDPFNEAVTVARRFGENDAFGFCPHVGIAAGRVTIGFVGSPVKYDCSAFGRPVAVAARCAAVRAHPKLPYASIATPAADWADRSFAELFPSKRVQLPGGGEQQQPTKWKLHPPRSVEPKNMAPMDVIVIENTSIWVPSISAEDWARRSVAGDTE